MKKFFMICAITALVGVAIAVIVGLNGLATSTDTSGLVIIASALGGLIPIGILWMLIEIAEALTAPKGSGL